MQKISLSEANKKKVTFSVGVKVGVMLALGAACVFFIYGALNDESEPSLIPISYLEPEVIQPVDPHVQKSETAINATSLPASITTTSDPTSVEKEVASNGLQNPSNTMPELSILLAQIEIGKAELELAKIEKEKKGLQLEESDFFPPVMMPVGSAMDTAQSSQLPISIPPSLQVLSVQGLGSSLTATLTTASGTVTVKKGDELPEGTVTAISVDGVTLKDQVGKNRKLLFAF